MKSIVLGVALAVIVLGTVIFMRGGVSLREGAMKPPAEAKPGKTSDVGSLAPSVPIAPTPFAAAKGPTSVGASKVSALMADINRGRNFKAIHDRLSVAPQRTPEES